MKIMKKAFIYWRIVKLINRFLIQGVKMVTLKEPMVWKEEDGTQYKISYSEKLQLEQLEATKELAKWHKRSFYAKIALFGLGLVFTASVLYVFFWLDKADFFMKVMNRM